MHALYKHCASSSETQTKLDAGISQHCQPHDQSGIATSSEILSISISDQYFFPIHVGPAQ